MIIAGSAHTRAKGILRILKRRYPHVQTALRYSNPFELLVATILSAQCTDARVNIVTASLFKKYKKISDYAFANRQKFEQDIRSTGFYRNKAKSIIAAAGRIIKDFKGNVPDTMEELITLPGVARKTANIVLFGAFGKNEGIAVDTHVYRLSRRLGLSASVKPEKMEQDLMKLFNRPQWGGINYLLVEHGRKVCVARKPRCVECVLQKICPSRNLFTAH